MAFRLLHCADLHLGQRFHDQDRSADEDHALEQIVAICCEEDVDVVIIAGDVFDTANPGAGEVARYHRFLTRLAIDLGVGTIVVTAGNHDNASRIEGARELLARCRIHTIGSLRLTDPVEKALIPLHDRHGTRVGTCAAIPFLRDGDVRQAAAGEDPPTAARLHVEAVTQRLAAVLAAAPADLPLVVSGHAYLSGGDAAGDERPVQVGNLGRIPAVAMAGDAAYVAMGHLHRPQAIAGNDHWRYCGSLLPTGFDEIDRERSVVVATITGPEPAAARCIPLQPYRGYRQLRGTASGLAAAIGALDAVAEGEVSPWLRLVVTGAQVQPGLAQPLVELAGGRGWQVLGVHLQPGVAPRADGQAPFPPVDDILARPDAVFTRLLDERGIVEEREGLIAAFASLRERCAELLTTR